MKQYFEILELQPGATPDEVKTAYRDLAKVWHPDRFKSDSPRLKSKAAEKLAEINEAYEKIRAYQARQKARKQSGQSESPGSRNHTGYRPYSPGAGSSGAGQTYSGYSRPTPGGRSQHRPGTNGTSKPQSNSRSQSNTYRRSRRQSSARHQSGSRHQSNARSRAGSSSTGAHSNSGQSPFRQSANAATPTHTLARRRQVAMQYSPNYTYAYKKRRRRDKNSMAIYLAAGALLAITIAGVFFFMQEKEPETPTLAQWSASPEASGATARETAPAASQAQVSVDLEPGEAVVTQEAGLMQIETRPVNTRKLSGHQAPAGFFTLGSTKSEVINIQGRPEQVMEGLFRYGFSSVFFEDDVVIGWHQSHDTQLMVKMLPRKPFEATYFTKGSTRDEVISIQGTPDHYRDRGRELRYGESRITFEKGRVTSWHQHADTPLKVKLLPRMFSNATHFTYNSTRDEVLSVQGTPTHFGENTFHYGYSTVQFKNDRVIGWNQATSYPLKIDLQPSVPMSTKFFTKGSTRDEVIAAQGTPDQYSDQIFKYGHSSISFENNRVVSWWESAASPLKARDN